MTASSRAQRLFAGWSANLLQTVLGVTQQVVLIPVFLHFWSGDVLAGWLVIYAIGNLIPIADFGLQFRAINRFLALKSSVDGDGRTASYYAAMLRIYLGTAGILAIPLLAGSYLVSPSAILGFQAVADFDTAFVLMAVGAMLALPSGLASSLYRARGLYGHAVRLQNCGVLVGQIGQLIAIVVTGSLVAVTAAYIAAQILTAAYFLSIDVFRQFPFLRARSVRPSWAWIIGQFRKAGPFAVVTAAELALPNLPVLLVSALVSDRVTVAQWGLTRVIAGLLRSLSVQTMLPLAAELGHDFAAGMKEELRNLYARGSALVTIQASFVVSGLLSFWPDFFALWTHGAVPYDPVLTITLLIGTCMAAPSTLALGYATYSSRGQLLMLTKGLQLIVIVMLSILLIPPAGALGAAIAIVVSDVFVQFGLLGGVIIRQTLIRPLRHVVFLAVTMLLVISAGWALGFVIQMWMPGSGLLRFVAECSLWLIICTLVASPLMRSNIRNRLIATIPR